MRWAAAAVFLCLGFLLFFPDEPEGAGWRLLAPEGAGGVVCRLLSGADVREAEVTPAADCCSSSAQWVLSAGRVDAAVLCPDAARHLLEKDGRYVEAGPCVLNADAWVSRPNGSRKVAVMQNREYQAEAVAAAGVSRSDIAPMLPAGIPYALEKGLVGGGVVDVLTALSLDGECRPLASEDIVAYVLVARRDFPDWDAFAAAWNACAESLAEDPQGALRALGLELDREGMELWKKLRVTFTRLK